MKVLREYIRRDIIINEVIVGANDKGKVFESIIKDLTYGHRILGFFDDTVDPFALISSPLLGGFDAIEIILLGKK
jgi:undecaprenyl-phosphate galactose phosphotransferase/putative colanic acid biosynthesis UDP-glucose lipid carrier transferase